MNTETRLIVTTKQARALAKELLLAAQEVDDKDGCGNHAIVIESGRWRIMTYVVDSSRFAAIV